MGIGQKSQSVARVMGGAGGQDMHRVVFNPHLRQGRKDEEVQKCGYVGRAEDGGGGGGGGV